LIATQLEKGLRADDSLIFFTAFAITKTLKTYKAVILLCRNEYGEDAFMLTRTLFELVITTSYILQDKTKKRLLRYLEHDWVIRKKMYDYIATKDDLLDKLNQEANSRGETNTIENVKSEYEKVMKKYKYNHTGWSDKSISKMAESVGRIDMYNTVYRLQCMMSHSNARSINEYVEEKNEEFIMGYEGTRWIEKTLILIFDLLFMIVEEANEQFKWSLEDTLDNLSEKFIREVGKLNTKQQ
jgi:hypothetical protein